MSNAVDLATKLTPVTAASLAKNGITHVGRYLSRSTWKGLTLEEVTVLKSTGLQIFSIFEKASTYTGYFTAVQGRADAQEGYTLAKELGQPEGTVIYFTVDFDAQPKDFPAILSYFQAIKANLQGYVMGCYGSHSVLTFLRSQGVSNYFFQTVAWSNGQRTGFNNLYQFQCDKQNWNGTGLSVDLVNLEKDDVGAWGQELKAQDVQSAKPVMVVKVLCDTDIRSAPSHTAGFIRNAQKDEILNVWEIQNDWHRVAAIPEQNVFGWIDGNGEKNLYWLDNPNLSKPAPTPAPVYHTVVAGDTVGKLAQANGVTIDQIKAWNNLDANYTIFAGKSIRVK